MNRLHFIYYYFGTKDGTGFTSDQFNTITHIFAQALEKNKLILLHCAGGGGRTSTALTGIWMKHFSEILRRMARIHI